MEKCVFRLSDSKILGVGFPTMSSMLFGRFLRFFEEIALPAAFPSSVVLPTRRLFTIRTDTVFIIIAPRLLKTADGIFFRFVDAFEMVRSGRLSKFKKNYRNSLKIEKKFEKMMFEIFEIELTISRNNG